MAKICLPYYLVCWIREWTKQTSFHLEGVSIDKGLIRNPDLEKTAGWLSPVPEIAPCPINPFQG